MKVTREQVNHCFEQATVAGRFSQAYCLDMLLELIEKVQREEAKLWGGTEHEARWAGAGCWKCDRRAELEKVPVVQAT
jgi:hypothetical protein